MTDHAAPYVDPLRIWSKVDSTPREWTKGFDTGTFKGTAIEQIGNFKQATQLFGPYGVGWWATVEKDEIVEVRSEVLHRMTVALHYIDPTTQLEGYALGFGITRVAYTTAKGREMIDAEFNKKTWTDALGNALRTLGFRADVYMGAFDDNKYTGVDKLKEEDPAEKAKTEALDRDVEAMQEHVRKIDGKGADDPFVIEADRWSKEEVDGTPRWKLLKQRAPKNFEAFSKAMMKAKQGRAA